MIFASRTSTRGSGARRAPGRPPGVFLARAATKARTADVAETLETQPASPPKAPKRSARTPGRPSLAVVQQHMSDASVARSVEFEGGKSFFVLGTSPYASRSIDDAKHAIHDMRPDAVVVDMSPDEAEVFLDREATSGTGTLRSLRFAYSNSIRRGITGLVEAALISYGLAIDDRTGVHSNSDAVAAAREAAALGIPVLFGGRSHQMLLESGAVDYGPIVNALRGITLGFAALVLAAAFPPGSALGLRPPWLKRGGAHEGQAPDGGVRWGVLAAGAATVAASPALAWGLPRAAAALEGREKLAKDLLELEDGVRPAWRKQMEEDDAKHLAWAAAAHPRLPHRARRVLAIVRRRNAKAVAAALESGRAEAIDGRALEVPAGASLAAAERERERLERAQGAAERLLAAPRPA